jgi:hypothetical protein
MGWQTFPKYRERAMKPLYLDIGLSCLLLPLLAEARDRWTPQQDNNWYATQGWRVGSNYIPATAINQLEMWQQETFDPKQIDWGLGTGSGRADRHDHHARFPARHAVDS